MAVVSSQSGIKSTNKDYTKYSLFLGGLDVTNRSLEQYNPLRTGYARLFIVKKPKFLEKVFTLSGDKGKFDNFFHMLEYGFTKIDGIQNATLDFEQISGGYTGRSFEIPTLAKDDTNAITITVFEMAGSPIREMTDMWINGISDQYTGLTQYHGVLDVDGVDGVSQANQTAEMIYVVTDSTGRSKGIEYACLLCNMVPKVIKKDHFNYDSGSHPLVPYDIEFTATKYESQQINTIAKALIEKHSILANYSYFKAGYLQTDVEGREDMSSKWAVKDGTGAVTGLDTNTPWGLTGDGPSVTTSSSQKGPTLPTAEEKKAAISKQISDLNALSASIR